MRIPVIVTTCGLGIMLSISAAAAQSSSDKKNQQKVVCTVYYHQGMVIRRKHNCAKNASWQADERRHREQRAIMDLQNRALVGKIHQ